MIDPPNMCVLIVDDMEMMCKSMRGMMRVLGLGKTFLFAQNGLDAWNILKTEPVDLAIVDWNMPVMTGVELLTRIREDRVLRDLPVVMVTAEANREIVAEAAESDIDAYILKPFTARSMGEKILSVIERANHPPPMTLHLKNARDLEENGDVAGAIEEAMLAMEAEPQSSKPIRELGYLYFKKNDLGSAEKWLLKAAKMNKLDVFAFHYLGELYLKRNDIDNASKYFDKAMNISPRHVSRGIEFGKVLVQKKMTKRAEKVFDKAISLSSDPLSTYEEVADFCLENGMYDYAIRLMGFILSTMPTRSDIMFKIGVAHENQEKPREALSYFIDAEKKDKDNSEIKIHMAKNYIQLKQMIRAERILKSLIKVDPENKNAQQLLRQTV